jgi:hypothetical protein
VRRALRVVHLDAVGFERPNTFSLFGDRERVEAIGPPLRHRVAAVRAGFAIGINATSMRPRRWVLGSVDEARDVRVAARNRLSS